MCATMLNVMGHVQRVKWAVPVQLLILDSKLLVPDNALMLESACFRGQLCWLEMERWVWQFINRREVATFWTCLFTWNPGLHYMSPSFIQTGRTGMGKNIASSTQNT
jgi:hypothetical protein